MYYKYIRAESVGLYDTSIYFLAFEKYRTKIFITFIHICIIFIFVGLWIIPILVNQWKNLHDIKGHIVNSLLTLV